MTYSYCACCSAPAFLNETTMFFRTWIFSFLPGARGTYILYKLDMLSITFYINI